MVFLLHVRVCACAHCCMNCSFWSKVGGRFTGRGLQGPESVQTQALTAMIHYSKKEGATSNDHCSHDKQH